jgi:RNA polymerase sigma-70 factor (ECF subfamily)
MEPEDVFRPTDTPLNHISTLWSVVARYQQGTPAEVSAAQQEMLRRYGKAVDRYLRGAVRDADAAEELAQEFALRFVRGDFKGADPQRGRFRDYVKGVLIHLVTDYHRRRSRGPLVGADLPEPAVEEPPAAEADRAFLESWRKELLARTWDALARLEERTGKPLHAALRLRADAPDVPSADLAERLAARTGRPCNAAAFRQTLHRAREKFIELLIDEVAQTLDQPSRHDVEQELAELRLLDYCRHSLDRFGPGEG